MNNLVFGGIDSSTYDIYISGEGLFNAPERDAEMITIPGRNGALLQDRGRYENIKVTYSCFCYKSTYSAFITAIDNFRNAIASKVGYQQLSDSYNSTEYRMAAFIGGLDVDPIMYNSGATFDLTFDCKPQRFLKTGDTAVTVANNGTISNPTLFDARPLLEVKGYGSINFDGKTIVVNNAMLGNIVVSTSKHYTNENSGINGTTTISLINTNKLNNGDTISIPKIRQEFGLTFSKNLLYSGATISSSGLTVEMRFEEDKSAEYMLAFDSNTIQYGTAASWSASFSATFTFSDNSTLTKNVTASFVYAGGDNVKITFSGYAPSGTLTKTTAQLAVPRFIGTSTKSVLGDPTYIDCDIGEAYLVQSDEKFSLNNVVQLPSELPVLVPGSTTVTYDNTVTSFKIVPRWWKI